MSDETRDDPQASLMAGAADSETAASRRPRASSLRRALADVGRDTFLRRGSTPGQARVPSDQRVLRELEELRRELDRLSSSGPTPRAISPPASQHTADKRGVMRQHRSDPLMSDDAWEDTQTSLMAGAAVVRGTLRRSTRTLPRSLSDPEIAASHRAASDRRATSTACRAQARGDAGRDSFPRRGSKTDVMYKHHSDPLPKSPPASQDTKDKRGVMRQHRSDHLMSDEVWENTQTSLMAGAAVRDSFPRRGSNIGPVRVPRDQRAMQDLEEGSPRYADARFDDEFKLSLSRRSGTAIPDMAHENRPRRPAHQLSRRSVDEAAGGPLSGGVGTGQRYSYSESSLDACEAAQRRQRAQVHYENEQSDQATLRRNQYLAAQQLHAARRKLELATLVWEHAKESLQLAKENVRRRNVTVTNLNADADAEADKDTTADMDTDTDSPSTSTINTSWPPQRPHERLTQRIKWLCLLLFLPLCGLLMSFWMYVPGLPPPPSGEDTN